MPVPKKIRVDEEEVDNGYLPKEDEGVSMFKLAIRGG